MLLEFHKAPGSTTIFYGSSSFAGGALRIETLGIKEQLVFNSDLQLPIVEVVVFVNKSLIETKLKMVQGDFVGIIHETHCADPLNAIAFAADQEVMQMNIVSDHQNLHDFMKISNRCVAAHRDVPPNHWTDTFHIMPKLVNVGCIMLAHEKLLFITKETIDELQPKLQKGDTLLVAELSRLGCEMLQVLNIINDLSKKGVKTTFVRQPELSTTGSHGKLLLAIYSCFAEAEREFISIRVKQGLATTRAKRVKLGRPKGSHKEGFCRGDAVGHHLE